MKTILLLTDLSKKAENAAFYALKLAEKTNAKIILCHSIPVKELEFAHEIEETSPGEEAHLLSQDENGLDILAGRLKGLVHEGGIVPDIETIIKKGDLVENVKELIDEKDVDLIVMGAKSDDPKAFYLFGSDTFTVLENIKRPLLFIPEGCFHDTIKTILFSNDLKNKYHKAVDFLVDIAKIDESEIIIAHMGDSYNYNLEKYLDLFKNDSGYEKVSIRIIPGENVPDTLREIIPEISVDLVAMIYHEHVLYGHQIAGSRSKKMMYNHIVPLLILPD